LFAKKECLEMTTYKSSKTGDGQERLTITETHMTREVTERKDGTFRVDDIYPDGKTISGNGVSGWSGALHSVVRIDETPDDEDD
jgi:hypothetical protein